MPRTRSLLLVLRVRQELEQCICLLELARRSPRSRHRSRRAAKAPHHGCDVGSSKLHRDVCRSCLSTERSRRSRRLLAAPMRATLLSPAWVMCEATRKKQPFLSFFGHAENAATVPYKPQDVVELRSEIKDSFSHLPASHLWFFLVANLQISSSICP